MTTKGRKQRVSRSTAISLLAGLAVMSSVQISSASMSTPSEGTALGACAFSLQLQKSGAARTRYVAQVVSVVGGAGVTSGNAVEEMYSNVKPASYSVDEYSGEQADVPTLSRLGAHKAASGRIDAFSSDCLTCHDGVGASSVNVDLRNNPYSHRSQINSFKTDHPIGMNYSSYVAVDKGYKMINPNNFKMIFVNGKVGCLSCHDPLNPEKGHLVMSDRDSALCTTCHNK